MSKGDIKVILTAPVHLQRDALQALHYAYHNSDFSHGFACILCDSRHWVVKRNKAGYSVLLSESDT